MALQSDPMKHYDNSKAGCRRCSTNCAIGIGGSIGSDPWGSRLRTVAVTYTEDKGEKVAKSIEVKAATP